MEYWSGKFIESLAENEVFVFGSNPSGIHGAGGAKAARAYGAVMGQGRGLMGNSYGIVTKNLDGKKGYLEKSTGIVYEKSGYKSVSPKMIRENIDEFYKIALEHKDKQFLISYQLETYPNGTPKKSLNGYTSQEMLEMFVRDDIPANIVFHDSYKPHLEKIFNKTQSNIESIPQKEVPPKEPKKTFDDVINFTRVALPFGWMGNMAPYPVEHEGVKYKTTEALFQALRFTAYPDIQDKIRNEASPMSAKMVAKSHKDLLEASGYELMGAQDVANMKLCIRLKLEQHPQLAQQLIDSGNKTIIEDCTSRPQGSGVFWGSTYQNGAWTGKNILGEILMETRMKLQNNANPVENTAKPQYTYFFHLTSPFSNFHPAKFEYKELTFISNEQFMMYSKAKNFKDEVSAAKILELNQTPIARDFIDGKITREQIVNNKDWADEWNKLMMSVKKLGRGVENYDDLVWTNKRQKIVLFGARLKFTQNEDLKQILLNTGNNLMCEGSKFDKTSTMQNVIQKLKEEFSLEVKDRNKYKP